VEREVRELRIWFQEAEIITTCQIRSQLSNPGGIGCEENTMPVSPTDIHPGKCFRALGRIRRVENLKAGLVTYREFDLTESGVPVDSPTLHAAIGIFAIEAHDEVKLVNMEWRCATLPE
jgi:hypothetical protein